MTIQVKRKGAVKFEMTDPSGLVQSTLEAYAKSSGLAAAASHGIRQGDCSVCDGVRHHLASAAAEYIGSLDRTVRAVYTYEPEYATGSDIAPEDLPKRSTGIYMIIWAERKTAALLALQASLAASMMEQWKKLGCPNLSGRCSTIDIQIVSDEDVERRRGYGALIDSVHLSPLRVWEK